MLNRTVKISLPFALSFTLASMLLNTSIAANISQPNQTSIAPHYQTMYVYCPPSSTLKKNRDPNKMTWHAKGGWKSYTPSFVNKIGGFVGARWIGTNIGRLGCYYKGVESETFPVIMVYHTITLIPKIGKWRRLNYGNYICSSNQQKQCPALVRLQPKKKNIYEEAKQLKYK